ncbi:MAG: CapA family protein [Patescibacteria group bacterium]|jgi:poly-gamma-glutamate synthesis protein (capsule biosynthesis protein)
MKAKKIIGIILFFVFGLIAIILIGRYYWLYSENNTPRTIPNKQDSTSNNQQLNEQKFLDFSTQKKKLLAAGAEVSLVAVGDISYSRSVERTVKKQKDINYPFREIRDYLKNADLVFGNLETPITAGREIATGEMIFRSNPGTEQALQETGFSVLSLANNHTPNFGEPGLKDTFNYLRQAGLNYVGAGKNEQEANQPIYLEKKGIKFAWLAYNDSDVVPASYEAGVARTGTAFMRTEKMIKAVREAKQKVDFVIVSMHSGTEYVQGPNNSQINFAHAAIDAGADLIIGHHPHVVQTLEKYQEKYIFYSLGNFIFDQAFSQDTKDGLMIQVYFTKNGISKISLLPLTNKNFAQPSIVTGSEAEKILQRLAFPWANQAIYFWNSKNNNFEKTYRATIYNRTLQNITATSQKELADLDHNSIPETYTLENGQLIITENAKTIWQSPPDWWLDNFILADSNNDGIIDLNLSAWRTGDFGSSKPFWIKENDLSIKNHFFVFDLLAEAIKPIWQSSNLEAPNCESVLADIDGDAKNELIVIEGDYSQTPECRGNYIAVWKWNGWGFSNEWRSEKGNFSDIKIEKIEGKNYITANISN